MESGSYRDLPAVHKLLEHEDVREWQKQYARLDVVASLQETLEALRDQVREGLSPDLSEDAVTKLAKERLRVRTIMRVRHVINATGTVLHTNLGRAPLAEEAIAAVADVARGYSNLEFDLETGERGERYTHVEGLLCELTGAEAALVVNNNAAAVWLVLHELAKDRRVVISRGELVEIGGSFRISEVMRASGAHLVEVGTTNKTHERDYEQALAEGADLLMRVHASNFRIVGFTYHPPLTALVDLAREFQVPFYEDLGSGSLVDLRELGIGDEPTVRASIEAGVDVVTFSGDKLLGATQAGIICGKREFIGRLKKNQLARALRVDKLTLAGLEATLRLYRDQEQALEKIPALRMLTIPVADLRTRAEQLAREITLCAGGYVRCRVLETTAQVGGGALPTERLASSALALYPMSGSPDKLVTALREETPPIVARVAREEVICDVRTVFPWEDEALVQGIRGAAARSAQSD